MKSLLLRLTGPSNDQGASAVLIALTVLVLMGFTAVALDAAGLGFNERRQNQSAADVGALTAVQSAVTQNLGNGCTGDPEDIARCNGAHEAIEVANATLDDASLADWNDATRCATPPAGFTASSVSPCVAFNSNAQRAWVRIPTIDNPTTFGKVIGFDTVSTTADAIAGTSSEPPSGVLPFLLPGGSSGANYECLKAGSNPDWGPCADNLVSGDFGSADFFLYGNEDKEWDEKCSGDTNGRLVANIARGTDHPLSTHPSGSGSGIEEEDNCPVYSAQPNMVKSQTGIGSNLEKGLLYGDSAYASAPYPGKLEDSSGFLVRNGNGSTDPAMVDHDPLWNYLVDDADDASLAGSDCDDDDITSAPDTDKPQLMEDCINWARGAGKVVFTDDLADSIRFGWVPQMYQNTFSGNPYYIELYRPVYLDSTFYDCNNNECDIIHTPGISDSGACPGTPPPDTRITCGTPGIHNDSLVAVASWILDAAIVPDNAKSPSPGSINQRTFNLID